MATKDKNISKLSKFTIQKRIGGGNFADVFLVFDKESQTQVAIKKIKTPKKQISPKILELLHSEIHVLKSIKNENIVKLYDSFRENDYYHLVMEYCNGGDFEKYLQSQEEQGISEEEALGYLKQLLNGFRALHDMKVMHRDFKLENILIKDGILKIADFGFCKQTDVAATSAGTGYYMAPEIMDRNFYTNKVDIWSLGVCLYRMLFKDFPFKPKDETRVALRAKIKENSVDFYNYGGRKISPKMQNLISSMLIEDPEKRIGWAEIYSHSLLNVAEPQKNGLSGSACEILKRKDLAKEKQKFQFEMNKLEYSTNPKIFSNKDCEMSLKKFAKEDDDEKCSFVTPMNDYSDIKESNAEKTLVRKKKKIDKVEESDEDEDEESLKTIQRKNDKNNSSKYAEKPLAKKKKESDYSSDEEKDDKFKKKQSKVSEKPNKKKEDSDSDEENYNLKKKPNKIKSDSDSDKEDDKLKKKETKTNKQEERGNNKKKKESDSDESEEEDKKHKEKQRKNSKYEEKQDSKKNIKKEDSNSDESEEDKKHKEKQRNNSKYEEKQKNIKKEDINSDESEEEDKKYKEKQRKDSKYKEKQDSKKNIKKEDSDDDDTEGEDKKFKEKERKVSKKDEKPNSKKNIKSQDNFDSEEEEAKLPPKNQEDRRFSQKSSESFGSNKNGENQRLISKAEERDISEMVKKKAEAMQLLERKYLYQRNSISIYAKILNEGFLLHEGKEATFVFFFIFKKMMLLSERLAQNLTEEVNIFGVEQTVFFSLLDSDFYKDLTQILLTNMEVYRNFFYDFLDEAKHRSYVRFYEVAAGELNDDFSNEGNIDKMLILAISDYFDSFKESQEFEKEKSIYLNELADCADFTNNFEFDPSKEEGFDFEGYQNLYKDKPHEKLLKKLTKKSKKLSSKIISKD